MPAAAAASAAPAAMADPLQEADFHIAYGLYGQASDLLKRSIEREPARRDLKLKLLEVYYLSGNPEGFLSLAEALRASAGRSVEADEEWSRITVMGAKLLPKHPLFATAERQASAPTIPLDLDLGRVSGQADDTQPRLASLDENTMTMALPVATAPESDPTLELAREQFPAALASTDTAEVTGTVRLMLDESEKIKLDDFVASHGASADAQPMPAPAENPVRAPREESKGDTTLIEKLSLADLGLPDLEGVTLSEVGTKLDLARAYMEMGDPDGARQILNEVIREGSPAQQSDARRLLAAIPG
jgi:pilus assembly protein FimV